VLEQKVCVLALRYGHRQQQRLLLRLAFLCAVQRCRFEPSCIPCVTYCTLLQYILCQSAHAALTMSPDPMIMLPASANLAHLSMCCAVLCRAKLATWLQRRGHSLATAFHMFEELGI
jgi:hypothetical protein